MNQPTNGKDDTETEMFIISKSRIHFSHIPIAKNLLLDSFLKTWNKANADELTLKEQNRTTVIWGL